MTPTGPWPADLTGTVGRQVQRYRKERGLTAEQLAAAVTAAGLRYTRAQVTNLEAARRDTVTLGELLIFGHVLDVPPVVLAFPVGETAKVEVLPDHVCETWDALRWFTGERPQAAASHEQLDAWRAASESLRLHRRHQRLTAELAENQIRIHEALATRVKHETTDADRATAEQLMDAERKTAHQLEERLRDLRRQMRQQNITPPPLLDGWTYLDREVDAP
jgi:transcriptional regulator with XRE-family HTH domain